MLLQVRFNRFVREGFGANYSNILVSGVPSCLIFDNTTLHTKSCLYSQGRAEPEVQLSQIRLLGRKLCVVVLRRCC